MPFHLRHRSLSSAQTTSKPSTSISSGGSSSSQAGSAQTQQAPPSPIRAAHFPSLSPTAASASSSVVTAANGGMKRPMSSHRREASTPNTGSNYGGGRGPAIFQYQHVGEQQHPMGIHEALLSPDGGSRGRNGRDEQEYNDDDAASQLTGVDGRRVNGSGASARGFGVGATPSADVTICRMYDVILEKDRPEFQDADVSQENAVHSCECATFFMRMTES